MRASAEVANFLPEIFLYGLELSLSPLGCMLVFAAFLFSSGVVFVICFSFLCLCAQGGDAGGLGLGGVGGEKDALLLLGLFTLVLVGSLAQDLAGDTWEKVQKEVKDETAAREANPEAYAAEASDGSEGFASLLPFNVTAVTQGALSIVPEVR